MHCCLLFWCQCSSAFPASFCLVFRFKILVADWTFHFFSFQFVLFYRSPLCVKSADHSLMCFFSPAHVLCCNKINSECLSVWTSHSNTSQKSTVGVWSFISNANQFFCPVMCIVYVGVPFCEPLVSVLCQKKFCCFAHLFSFVLYCLFLYWISPC